MRQPLTERQQQFYDYIVETIRSTGVPPVIREMMEEFGLNSTNGVRTTLKALEKKGHIRRRFGLARSIQLVEPEELETRSADDDDATMDEPNHVDNRLNRKAS